MPVVDMALEELKTYQGINPCPTNHATYWEESLAEMRALGVECERIPSTFQSRGVECFDLYFIGVHGARVHAQFVRPAQHQTPCPAVLLFHGYSGDCGAWNDKLKYASAGFVVAALDCRGQSGLSEDVGGVQGTTFKGQIIRGLDDPDPKRLLFRDIFLDTAQLARIVMAMPEVDETRISAHGGSQGGGLTLACAALEPRIAFAAPSVPFLTDYRRVWDMDLDVAAYEELRYYFRHYDPLHLRERDVFERLGYVDVQHLAHRIRARVMMVTGLLDTICPPSTQFAVYNKIVSEKQVLVFPDYGHENPDFAEDIIFQEMLKV